MAGMVKKIHVCWFGSPMPDMVKRNVDRWAVLNPDFEICLYHEGNIDVSAYEFGRRALEQEKWGFLVDIIRPQALLREGGFYLDADVELVRPLNCLEPWGDKLVMGYMYDCALGTAALYAPPAHSYLTDILSRYERIQPAVWPVSNSVFTEYFVNEVPGFLLNGREWENEHCKLFRKEFFEQPSFRRQQGLAIHHCCGSWKTASSSFTFDGTVSLRSHFLKWASRQLRTWHSCRHNEFTPIWRAACKGVRRHFDTSIYYIAHE